MRLRFRRRPPLDDTLERVPDDLPRSGLLREPLVVERIDVLGAEEVGPGTVRSAFRLRVRDADGKRCPDVAVDATIAGPERTASGQATTDLFGQVTFRMTGPSGRYVLTVDDVAAGGLAWDAEGSVRTATCEA